MRIDLRISAEGEKNSESDYKQHQNTYLKEKN